MYRALGLDLGVRSGAAVLVEWEETGLMQTPVIQSVMTLWKGEKSKPKAQQRPSPRTPSALGLLSREITRSMSHIEPLVIGVDWGFHEAYFRGGRAQLLQKAFLAGFVHRDLLEQGKQAIFVSPSQAREFLALKKNVSKETVGMAIADWFPHPRPLLNDHELDAVLLGICAHRAMRTDEEEAAWNSLIVD